MRDYECSFDVNHTKHFEVITAKNETNARKNIIDKYPEAKITWHYCKPQKEDKKAKGDK